MSVDTNLAAEQAFPAGTDALSTFARRLARFATYFLACLEVARQRRSLLKLDPRALGDIGISRADALREAGRSFWDIPDAAKRGD